jgi:hypothetical protein
MIPEDRLLTLWMLVHVFHLHIGLTWALWACFDQTLKRLENQVPLSIKSGTRRVTIEWRCSASFCSCLRLRLRLRNFPSS